MSSNEIILTMDSFTLPSLGVHMLFKEIDQVSSIETCEFLLKANLVMNDTVTLFINSPGGSVTDGWAIVDMMETSRIPIATVAIGEIASMAVPIFTAGAKGKRVMAPNTTVMTHQFSTFLYGKSHELIAVRKFHDSLEEKFIAHFLRHTKMNEKQIREILLGPSDCYLEPKECLKYGICDEVRIPYTNPHEPEQQQKPKTPRRKKAQQEEQTPE